MGLKNFWDCGRKEMKSFFVNEVGKMEKVNKDYGWSRGEESEQKVSQVLDELKSEGTIKNFGQSLKFYREDKSGRDFAIVTDDDKIVWLQVKSSFNENAKRKYLRHGIHYLAVGQKTSEEIKKEILKILKKKSKLAKTPDIKEKVEVQIQ